MEKITNGFLSSAKSVLKITDTQRNKKTEKVMMDHMSK